MVEEDRLLAPFPDELVERGDVGGAIELLNRLRIPEPFASDHLKRFARFVGVELERAQFDAVGGPFAELEESP